MTLTANPIPEAVHVGADALPFATLPDGSRLKVLQVREKEGLWIVQAIFNAGYEVQTHRHTGPVWGYTVSGAWKYKEYPEVNTAGSYLFEPAGSVHTLIVPETNTEVTDVWFAIYGANLNLAEDGSVDMVIDAQLVLEFYLALCQAQGIENPPVIGI